MKVEIIKMDHFGRGIAKINQKVVFIKNALPNEIVEFKIIKNKKSFSEGEIVKIIKKSASRITPICPYYNKCGGCQFLHVGYEEEKKYKMSKATEILGNINSFYETKSLNYRNKVTLHIQNNQIGYYQEKSNIIVPIKLCYLLNDKLNEIICKLQDCNLQEVKSIILKVHQNKTLMAIDGEVNNSFVDNFPFVDNILINNKVIKGNNYLEEVIDHKIFRVTAYSFFQVNKIGLENINSILKIFISSKKIHHALDLYGGTGLWSILLSDYVDEITSIEINKEASFNAKINVKNNNLNNIKVINGKVEDYIQNFKNINLIITDPPRSGLDNKTKKNIISIAPDYFIYISCDMLTLKRDLNDFSSIFNVEEIDLIDMFRGTYHVETVCLLSRKTLE